MGVYELLYFFVLGTPWVWHIKILAIGLWTLLIITSAASWKLGLKRTAWWVGDGARAIDYELVGFASFIVFIVKIKN